MWDQQRQSTLDAAGFGGDSPEAVTTPGAAAAAEAKAAATTAVSRSGSRRSLQSIEVGSESSVAGAGAGAGTGAGAGADGGIAGVENGGERDTSAAIAQVLLPPPPGTGENGLI